MPEWLLWIGGVLIFVVILLVSVGLHEAGHMVAAKKLGVKVPEFFVGFGPKLFSFKKGETEYGARAIPLGGYVRLYDPEITDKDDERREMLSNVKPWKRQIIFAAGPAVNIFLGFAILTTYLMFTPYLQVTNEVEKVNVCSVEETVCGASEVGVLPGDKIIQVGSIPIDNFEEMKEAIGEAGSLTNIVVERNGKDVKLNDVRVIDGRIGVSQSSFMANRNFGESLVEVNNMLVQTIKGIGSIPAKVPGLVTSIFTGDRDPESPGSIVGVGRAYGDVAATDQIDDENKVGFMILTAGAVNLSLGLINLVPFTYLLDGGKMAVAFIDSIRIQLAKIKKKKYNPLGYNVIKWSNVVPMALLFGMMALLILADIFAPVSLFG